MKILNQFSNYQSYQKALENETERLKEILKNKKEEQERLAMELLLKRQAEEQAHLEKEKLERQKLEAEEAERKRLEAERLEKERIEREKNAISEAKQKALQNIIDWAKTNNIPEERLPRNIIDLSKIKELNLSNLKLRDLPNDFYQMEQLTHLNLSGNFILKYSNNLANLKNLYLLDLSNCGLDEVPEFVFKIEKLGHLDVSENNLSYFFVDENEFNHLEHLDISSNKFEEDEIVKYKSYYENIKYFRINYINDAINSFKKTKIKRNLQSKKFKEIFQKYQEYLSLIKKEENEGIRYKERKSRKVESELKKIYENFFENFSFYSIQINSKLEKLKFLNLSNNGLFNYKEESFHSFDYLRKETFEKNILKLKSLEVLDIQNTNIKIEKIEEIEKKFPFLRILKISSSEGLTSLKSLRNLEKIHIKNKEYKDIDEYFREKRQEEARKRQEEERKRQEEERKRQEEERKRKIKKYIKYSIISVIILLIGYWLISWFIEYKNSLPPPPPPEPKGFFRKLFEGILAVIIFGISIILVSAGRR